MALAACGQSPPSGGDAGAASDAGTAGRDAASGDGGLCVRPTTLETCWTDPASQLTWEISPTPPVCNLQGAVDDCSGLVACGHDDWRVPDIDELRTLVRGCPDTVTGGACPVHAGADFDYPSVCGCEKFQGPGTDGCYWDPSLGGGDQCAWLAYSYWSSTDTSPGSKQAWVIAFYTGWILPSWKTEGQRVRCVRP